MAAGCADVPPRLVADLVAAATLAPSMHNTQPWRFRYEPRQPDHRAVCRPGPDAPVRRSRRPGRAHRVRRRAAQPPAGRGGGRPRAGAPADPGRRPAAAAGDGAAGRAVPRPGPTEIDLHAAIPERHTNRFPFSERPVPPGILAELTEAARLEGAVLHVPGHQEAARLLRLAREAERDLLAQPGYRAELARWAGGDRDRDGIPDPALAPRDPAGAAPVRDFAPDRPGRCGYAWFEDQPQLAVLSHAVQYAGPTGCAPGRRCSGCCSPRRCGASPPARSPSRWKQPTPGSSAIPGPASNTRR